MKILIKVTREILEKSANCRSSKELGLNCAISLAVREIFPNAFTTREFILPNYPKSLYEALFNTYRYTHLYIDDVYPFAKISLPEKAIEFIEEFDLNDIEYRKNMNPISFEVDVPHEVIHSIGISDIYKILSESKTLELVNI